MNVMRYRQALLSGVFIVTEALAWFAVIAVLAAMTERSFVDGLIDRLQMAASARQFTDPAAAELVLAQLREVQGQSAGPAWYIVVATALGGFALMRGVRRLDLGGPLGAIVLIAASLVGVNLLLHLSIGNLQFWDASYLAELLGRPDGQVASRVDLQAYVARGTVEGPFGGVVGLTFVGLFGTWFRFMLVARSPVRIEKVGRSFTASFLVILGSLVVAQVMGVSAAGWVAVPQFMLGMLGLAIANHERAVSVADAEGRATPWMTSVAGTLVLLLASVATIGALAYLQIGSLLSVIGDGLLMVIEFLLILILTPIAWVLERIFSWVMDGRTLPEGLLQMPNLVAPPEVPDELQGDSEGVIPQWARDTMKFFAIVGVFGILYWVGRYLLGRRDSEEEEVQERRQTSTGGAGVGRLLSDLLSFRRRGDPDRWLERHPVYRLFGDAVGASSERGLRMLPSETPGEFGRTAVAYLAATPVAEAAVLFDEARYGRHFPAEDRVRAVAASLATWDRANPPTEEMRERVRGLRPLDDGAEIALRISLAKKGISLEDQATIRGD